jgi:glycosyl transferase family 87
MPLPASPRASWIAGALCGLSGLAAWVFYVAAFRNDPGQDWMVFYTAARAWFDGNLPLLFDGERLTAALNQRFAGWMAHDLNLHPWVYPPHFLLLFLPFGMLPPVVSLVGFQLVGLIAVAAAALAYVRQDIGRWLVGFSLVLCPAVPFNVMTGQNAFFTSALLIGGFGLLARFPLLGGALLGIVTYKPQMWLMVPVALVAARQWRALMSAGAVAVALALLSLAVFGGDIWRAWIDLVGGGSEQYRAWLAEGRLNGLSVFACVRLTGAPEVVASLVQAAAVVFAAGCVYRMFRQRPADPMALAGLLAATLLAAPHSSASDAVLLGLAASLFLVAMQARGIETRHVVVAAVIWLCPLFNPPSVFSAGLLTPLLVGAFLWRILAELASEAEAAAMPSPAQTARGGARPERGSWRGTRR